MAGEITFTPRAVDHVAVARGSFRASLRRRRFAVRVVLMMLFGAGTGLGLSLLGDSFGIGWIVFGVLVAIGWLALILLGTWLLLPRRATRLFQQQRSLDQAFTFAWSDAGIVFRSDSSSSEVAWLRYHKWFEDADVFGFGLNEQLFHWAPKRAMTADAIADLRRTAAASGLPYA